MWKIETPNDNGALTMFTFSENLKFIEEKLWSSNSERVNYLNLKYIVA